MAGEANVKTGWQPIETAPKDGGSIIGGYFHTPWSESHLRGQIVKCWYQPEFGAFISGCREMSLAAGYSFENGSSTQLHSPEYAPVSHWMPLPDPPAQVDGRRMVETRSGSMRSTTSPVVASSDDAPDPCDPSPNSSQDRV